MKRKRSKGSIHSKRLRDYRYADKKKGYLNDLSLEGVKALIQLPCYYCTKPKALGLDRLDNDKGHEGSNVVPACSECNYILSTLPLAAKIEMRETLRHIYEKNLLKDWQPIFMEPKPKNALKFLKENNDNENSGIEDPGNVQEEIAVAPIHVPSEC